MVSARMLAMARDSHSLSTGPPGNPVRPLR